MSDRISEIRARLRDFRSGQRERVSVFYEADVCFLLDRLQQAQDSIYRLYDRIDGYESAAEAADARAAKATDDLVDALARAEYAETELRRLQALARPSVSGHFTAVLCNVSSTKTNDRFRIVNVGRSDDRQHEEVHG